MAKFNKKVTTIIKIVVSILLIYFIFSKINLSEIKEIIIKSSIIYLVIALFFFLISKIIAAFRLNLYFHQLEVPLTHKSNLELYLLGMFYNLFLPGGIGGDAYKGYILKKTFGVKTKKIISVLVLDRLCGLLLLFIYACGLLYFLELDILERFQWATIIVIPVSILVFWLLNKKFFVFVLPVFWKSFFLSALVQLAQLASIWCILLSLDISLDRLAYLVIFLISSIVAVIPLTIGGLGSREITFYYAAEFLNLDPNTSVGISLLFFMITALVSITGIWFHFKKIKLKLVETAPTV
ncbi:MAG: lysylphosphatidylglycerol synthase transmembrane domain-containing protein [Maribacter sp.]